MEHPRDEREASADLELRTPQWIPGGRIALHYKRSWDHRAASFFRRALAGAGATEEELYARVEEDNGFSHLYSTAGQRAIEEGDQVVSDVLASLVAAALKDAARIHAASYIVDKLSHFHALHIRVLVSLSGSRGMELPELSKSVNASSVLTESAVSELIAANMAKRKDQERTRGATSANYFLFGLGAEAMRLIIDIDRDSINVDT